MELAILLGGRFFQGVGNDRGEEEECPGIATGQRGGKSGDNNGA